MRTMRLDAPTDGFEWRYETDYDASKDYTGEQLKSEGIWRPGTSCENEIGIKREFYDKISKEAVRAPRERYEYIAPLWVEREVIIPEDWEDKRIILYLERVNIASSVWVDGKRAGREITDLSVPHVHDITDVISPGKHTITMRIDNRNLLNLDTMASGYSVDTQGYWNGCVGALELRAENMIHIESLAVYPDMNGIDIKAVASSDVHSPFLTKDAEFAVTVVTPGGKELQTKVFKVKLFNSKQPEFWRYDINAPRLWDEFTPNLYTLRVKMTCDGVTDTKETRFGIRAIKTEGKKILLNGRQISLRGTIDCAQFPISGAPPMDKAFWSERFQVIKSYGLNHVRFHAWCPPQAAFDAADEAGVYVLAEMPLWLNRDVCALEVGEDTVHRSYFLNEAVNISREYGNHPSFIMFSNGNENMGDFDLLNDITTILKGYDGRRIYTLTSNFDHPVLPCEDYLSGYEASGHKVRLQDIQDLAATDTRLDYSKAVADTPVPIVSFEVGQYCVYPDVDIADDYTGAMLPVNFDAIRKFMKEKGVYGRLKDYIAASGDLAVKLYKEDIEAALRTKDFGGIELLSLSDYTGQSTATIGILDVMFRDKGLIAPEKFAEFAGAVVPLLKSDRIATGDTLETELDLYDFGMVPIEKPIYHVSAMTRGDVFYEADTTDTRVTIPIGNIGRPARVMIRVTVAGYGNEWRVFVFDNAVECPDVMFVNTPAELERAIEAGEHVIALRGCFDKVYEGNFIPVFWSPVHFPSQKSCGAIIDEMHPALADFPTERYPDYQWKSLFENSVNIDITGMRDIVPIVETVPNYFDNTPSSPLFERTINGVRVLCCGFNLSTDTPECRALRRSLCKYVSGHCAKKGC